MNRTLLGCYLVLAALFGAGRAAQAQKVGIGTTTPTQALDVNGQVRVRGLQGDAAGRLLGLAADGTLQAQPPTFGAPAPAAFAQLTGQATVATAGSPVDVVVNAAGTRAFVISSGSNTLETFDLSGVGPPRKISSLVLSYYSRPYALTLNPAGTRLYVLAGTTILTFDVGSGWPVQLATSTTGLAGIEVVVDAISSVVYVLANNGILISYSLSSSGVPFGGYFLNSPAAGAVYKLALNAAGTRAYLLVRGPGLGIGSLQLYDVSGGSTGSSVALGSVPLSYVPEALVLNAAGTRAYVVSSGSNILETFDLSGALPMSLGTVPTGNAPAALAANAAGTRLYVPNATDNTLQTYDISGPGLPVSLSTKPTGNAPQAVAAAPAGTRLYVANAGDNTLQVFDQQNQPRALAVSATGATGSLSAVQLLGAGRLPAAYGAVGSGGAVQGAASGFVATHPALGVYRLSFTTSPLSTTDLNQAAVVATLAGVAPGSVSYRTGRGYVEVLTYAPGGGATDRGFTFSVALP